MNKTCIILILMVFASCKNDNTPTDAWGNFETRETIISAKVAGTLQFLDAEKGQSIEKGVLLGLIDTTQHALNHRLLMHKRKAAATRNQDVDANITILKTRKQNLEREADRTRRLLQNQAATKQQLDDIEGKLLVIEKQIEAALVSKNTIDAELQSMDTQIALAQEQWDNCRIINPVEGTVLERYAEPHELVMQGKPLYKIADLSVMDLKVYVSGGQLPHIQLGQKATVYIDDVDRKVRPLEGTINWISSRAEFTPKTIQTRQERVNQVYAVKISVVNDGSIKIGMPGEVTF